MAKHLQLKPSYEIATHSWQCFYLDFSPSGKLLAVATREKEGAALIDTKSWKVKRMLIEADFPPTSIAFSPDEKSIVIAMGQQSPLYCWETANGKVLWTLPKVGMHVAFSSDGKLVATTKSKSVLLVEASTGKVVHCLEGHTARVDITDFSKDGRRVASVSKTQVWLWDAIKGKPICLLQDKQGIVDMMRFSPSGKILGVTSQDGGVRLYDSESGKQLTNLAGHENMAWDFAWMNDEKALVSVGWDNVVRIWNVSSGQLIRSIDLPQEMKYAAYLALSPDNSIVAIPLEYPFHQVRLYSTETGDFLATLQVDGINSNCKVRAQPSDSSFSPKGDWLASACDDGITRVWDMSQLSA